MLYSRVKSPCFQNFNPPVGIWDEFQLISPPPHTKMQCLLGGVTARRMHMLYAAPRHASLAEGNRPGPRSRCSKTTILDTSILRRMAILFLRFPILATRYHEIEIDNVKEEKNGTSISPVVLRINMDDGRISQSLALVLINSKIYAFHA